MRPIVIIVPNDGKVNAEDVHKLVEEAYNQGYEDGKNSVTVIPWQYPTVPYYPSGTFVQGENVQTLGQTMSKYSTT